MMNSNSNELDPNQIQDEEAEDDQEEQQDGQEEQDLFAMQQQLVSKH